MKTLITTLFMLAFVTCFSQKASFKLLEDQQFVPLTEYDQMYSISDVPRSINNFPEVELGFDFPVIGSRNVIVPGDGFVVKNGDYILRTALLQSKSFSDDSIGYIKYSNDSRILIDYRFEGQDSITVLQFNDMIFSKYPQYAFTYQVVISSSGEIKFYYGPHTFNESFIGYSDLYFIWNLMEDYKDVEYLLVGGQHQNPEFFDHYDDISMYQEFSPFSEVPNDFAFSINASRMLTGIAESTQETQFWNLNQGKLNILPCNRDREGLISVYASNGALLLTEEVSNSGKSIDLNAFKGQLLLVNYACDGKELQSEKFLIK